jgi:hypothetical protein
MLFGSSVYPNKSVSEVMNEKPIKITLHIPASSWEKRHQVVFECGDLNAAAAFIIDQQKILNITNEQLNSAEADDVISIDLMSKRSDVIFGYKSNQSRIYVNWPESWEDGSDQIKRQGQAILDTFAFLTIEGEGVFKPEVQNDTLFFSSLCEEQPQPQLQDKLLEAKSAIFLALQKALEKRKENEKDLVAQNARWWKSMETAFSLPVAIMGYANPANCALVTLIALSIALVIVKFTFPNASVSMIVSVAHISAYSFAGLLVIFVPLQLCQHYIRQRYKAWRAAKKSEIPQNQEESLKENEKESLVGPDLSYKAYLDDQRFTFGFIGYITSLFPLAWKNKGKVLLVVVGMLISALLIAASVGFLCGNPLCEHLMQPFFELMTLVLKQFQSEWSLETINIISAVVVSIFPLAIVDFLRRVIELFEEAKEYAEDPEYSYFVDPRWPNLEVRPEHHAFMGLVSSFKQVFASEVKDAEAFVLPDEVKHRNDAILGGDQNSDLQKLTHPK